MSPAAIDARLAEANPPNVLNLARGKHGALIQAGEFILISNEVDVSSSGGEATGAEESGGHTVWQVIEIEERWAISAR